MNEQIILILKVFIFSIGVSFLIKYAAPLFPVAPTLTNALIGVIVPPLIIILILWMRSKNNFEQERDS